MEIRSLLKSRWIVPVSTTSKSSTTMKKSLSSSFSIITIVLVTFNISLSQVHAMTEKAGRCPEPKMDPRLCGEKIDQCTSNSTCAGDSLCCFTGCNYVCIIPSYTACENVKNSAERRARALSPLDAETVRIPECDPVTGRFKDIQCDRNGNNCYCVDNQGFEIPGTRARSLDSVNCTNPKNCDGPQCRMFCPNGFEVSSETGCEVCECKNVCKNVKCPSNLACEEETVACTTEPCPPVASCKQPRSLNSLCPHGAPLIIPDSGLPFLCGETEQGKPSCPAAFQCQIKTGEEYGVCCASNNNFEKPGTCPLVAITKDSSLSGATTEELCTSSCRHDLDCPEFDKCCITQCGKQCSKPANSTVCLQQKHIAELLSQRELEGKGYIPQCDENGNFIPKQCSRNGKVCWCVSPDGKNNPQSIGASESVNCTNHQRQRAVLRSDDSYGCDKVICSTTCEFGFKIDRHGCPTCDCVESPCETFYKCPSGSKCEMISDPTCLKNECPMRPTCLTSGSLFVSVNPCPLGTPLTDMQSSQVVACSENATTCPSSHICVIVSPNQSGLCCPNRPRVEPTKPGMCPLLTNYLCNTTLELSHKKCSTDSECENSMKCCACGEHTVCADPLLHEERDEFKQSPTMCQYLRDARGKVEGVFNKFQLGIPEAECKDNGGFNEIQCDDTHCTCVDEYGAEIPGTMMEKQNHNLTSEACTKARNNPKCLEMNCRLACDYGYEYLDGCRICECRNPCMSKNGCGENEKCEMVDLDCWDGHCPPLPYCIPEVLVGRKELSYSCPKGNAFVTESNETLTCNPRARMLQCPDDFFCHDSESDFGLCCPILTEEEASKFLLVSNRKESSEMGIFDDGNLLLDEGESVHTKRGQCPYLIPFNTGSCGPSECQNDYHCPSTKKCCLNSCGGSQCLEPLLLTACQHQKSILEHKARENGIPAKRVFIPECDGNGEYLRIQSFGKQRWCVDSAGEEIQGTRVSISETVNCQKPSQCPQNKCSLQCEFGLQLDTNGCSICQCKPSPCNGHSCPRGEECRMMQLNCISEPCPPVPLCLPRLDNPCSFAAPLTFEETGERVPCGPGFGNCPSSHSCNVSPFGEYAVCCPKPKEICFEKRDPGNCKDVITKWFFNSTANQCQPFLYSGCGGNSNQFNSKAECLSVCPALTHCERMREKNTELVNKYHQFLYIPKCDPRQGEWESIQCFEEIGMCWCSNKKGEPIKGTMTNGLPNCQARRGRLLAGASEINPTVCEPGMTIHKCNKTLCQNKVCLGHPTAKCMINPCGGCHERWISEDGQELDCKSGLSKCHQEMQLVMNSQAWVNQGFSAAHQSEKEDASDFSELPSASSLGNALSEILLGESRGMANGGVNGILTRMSTKVMPIFAEIAGHRVMGVMSSTVTVMGDSSSEERQSGHPQERRVPSSPVRNIADILADMMTSQSRHGSERPRYAMDDFMDLMPSSSQVYPLREMLPPPPMLPDFGSDMPLARVRRAVESEEEIPDSLQVESSSSEHIVVPNREILVSIIPKRKFGKCPQPSHFALFNLLTGACEDECHYDHECEDHFKCCLSKCGLKCLEPESSEFMMEPQDDASSPNILSYEAYEPPTMVVSIPQCKSENGDYSPLQTQSDLSWCVTPDGQPIPETFTRGKLVCSENGTILQRFVKGPICDSEQTPMICREQCLHASCPLHPEAICVMDVCDSCTPSFYNPSGEKVVCQEKCQQPMAEPGFCRASILRYTFNITSEKCEEFIYGGCQGNDNNFQTLQECQSECERNELDLCSLPVKAGPCRASMPRWFFNTQSQMCEQFDYGGCGGNENNFMSKEHCETRCPDIVLCPNMIEGEMKTCSRTSACKNATCPNQHTNDYLCSVNPCNCEATLKDFNGNEVKCRTESQDEGTIDLDSVVVSSSDESKVESPISLSKNQVLQVSMDPSTLKSRCLSASEESRGVVTCDSQGQFTPLQCMRQESDTTPPTCYCVNEAGVRGNETFLKGSKSCAKAPIDKVEVSLNFPSWDDISSVQLGVEMQDLLRSMDAQLEEETVDVEVLPGSTNLKFALLGENKVDVSHFLEQMVKRNAIGVEDQGKIYPADSSTSKFHYVVSSPAQIVEEIVSEEEANEIPVDDVRRKENEEEDANQVSAESLALDDEYNTVAVLLTLVAAISAGLIVVGLFLSMQKKKSTGSYPKKPFESLAFSSQLYEIEKKVPKDLPTFKATPYVNEYRNTDETVSSK